MIFKQWQQVLDGTKTQTRRLVRISDEAIQRADTTLAPPWRFTYAVRRSKRLLWRVAQTYAVQPGRGKKAVGRIRIVAIRKEHLWNITEADCKAEIGHRAFPGASAYFIKLWSEIYAKPGTRWADNPEVWVLSFQKEEP